MTIKSDVTAFDMSAWVSEKSEHATENVLRMLDLARRASPRTDELAELEGEVAEALWDLTKLIDFANEKQAWHPSQRDFFLKHGEKGLKCLMDALFDRSSGAGELDAATLEGRLAKVTHASVPGVRVNLPGDRGHVVVARRGETITFDRFAPDESWISATHLHVSYGPRFEDYSSLQRQYDKLQVQDELAQARLRRLFARCHEVLAGTLSWAEFVADP